MIGGEVKRKNRPHPHTSSSGRYVNFNLRYMTRQLLALSVIERTRWWSLIGCRVKLKAGTRGSTTFNVKNIEELETHYNVWENCKIATRTAAPQTGIVLSSSAFKLALLVSCWIAHSGFHGNHYKITASVFLILSLSHIRFFNSETQSWGCNLPLTCSPVFT